MTHITRSLCSLTASDFACCSGRVGPAGWNVVTRPDHIVAFLELLRPTTQPARRSLDSVGRSIAQESPQH